MQQRVSRVILDTNSVFEYSQVRARIDPVEIPVITSVIAAELRDVSARKPKMRMPGYLGQFLVIEDVMAIDTRINIRAKLKPVPGRFADGVVGATALATGLPIITLDKELASVLREMGGVVR